MRYSFFRNAEVGKLANDISEEIEDCVRTLKALEESLLREMPNGIAGEELHAGHVRMINRVLEKLGQLQEEFVRLRGHVELDRTEQVASLGEGSQ